MKIFRGVTFIYEQRPGKYNDLRHVNIFSALSKGIEKVGYLNYYVISHKFVSDSQFGFRKGFSTACTLVDITEYT